MALELNDVFGDAFSGPIDLNCCLHSCEDDTELHPSVNSMKNFILEYGEQKHSLEGIHKIIKSLLEVNQKVISECREEWRHAQLFPLFYDYYRISHETSKLYNEFVRFLKDASDSWLRVKLAILKQILIKGRGDGYTCKDMLQQLVDLEAAKSIRFSDNFITSFARICEQTVTFTRYLNGMIRSKKKFKSMKVLAKVSCIIIAGFVSILATYTGGDRSKSLFSAEEIRSNSMWSHMTEKLLVMSIDKLPLPSHIWDSQRSFDRELQIWDFNDNAILLQELKKKMTGSSVSKENEVEMMIVIDKLGKKIDNISKTIEDMSSDSHKYSHDIRETGKTFNQFIADNNKLWATKFSFRPHEDMLQMKLFEDPMTKAVRNLFQATVFLPASLDWYIKSWEYNTIKSLVKSVLELPEADRFYGILEILRCLIIGFRRGRYEYLFDIRLGDEAWKHISVRPLVGHKQKYRSFGGPSISYELQLLLEGIYKSWRSVTLALEHILQRSREGYYTYGEMLQKVNDLEATGTVGFSGDFIKSFEYLCEKTADLFRCMSLVIYSNKQFTPAILERVTLGIYSNNVSKVQNTSILSIVATCMGDFKLLEEMENGFSNSTFFHPIELFSRKSGKWFDERGLVRKTSYDEEELRIWDCYGNEILLQELKQKMAGFSRLTEENDKEMMTVIHELKRKLDCLSKVLIELFGKQSDI